ncbi:hypothetical protein F5887DRAFT_895542 [Amanita rubescens]|nr:hypothetical protein F5887DRAFT_895542 [Amanita rubescens]
MPQPEHPRLSASLVILNHRNEVLLVHRNPKSRAYGGVHVFPGGNYDSQDASLEVTAIRETFEETGLLLASPEHSGSAIPESEWDKARHAVHGQELSFGDFLNKYKLKPAVDSLLPFTDWTTPEYAQRRFCTRFFVTFLHASYSSRFSTGTKQDFLPTSDGGKEIVSTRFVHPSDALAEFHRKEITLMPPQYYILHTLSDILPRGINTQSQCEKVERLSRGAFGKLSFNPKHFPPEDGDADPKRMLLVYEGDETRGGPPGRLHRAFVKHDEHGVTREIELHRNFDIFKDIESGPASTKL